MFAQSFFGVLNCFKKLVGEKKRRENFQNQMTVEIQFGDTCQIPTFLRHDVTHSPNQYSANGLGFILNMSFII